MPPSSPHHPSRPQRRATMGPLVIDRVYCKGSQRVTEGYVVVLSLRRRPNPVTVGPWILWPHVLTETFTTLRRCRSRRHDVLRIHVSIHQSADLFISPHEGGSCLTLGPLRSIESLQVIDYSLYCHEPSHRRVPHVLPSAAFDLSSVVHLRTAELSQRTARIFSRRSTRLRTDATFLCFHTTISSPTSSSTHLQMSASRNLSISYVSAADRKDVTRIPAWSRGRSRAQAG